MSRRTRNERGAVAVLTAVVLTVLLVMAAFAVDLGKQRVVRRDAQAVADTTAMDMVRLLGNGEPVSDAIGRTAAWRTRGMLDDQPGVEVHEGYIGPSATYIADQSLGCSGSPYNSYFRDPASAGEPANAVLVVVVGSVDFAFAPGGGSACRSAIAMAEEGACFSVGSYAASLEAGASPILGPLLGALGSDLSLTVADHQGLANAEVSLLTFLGVDLGAGTMQELIDGGELVSIGDFYLALAKAITKDSGSTAQVLLLEQIAAGLDVGQVRLGELIDLGAGGAHAGLDATLNVLDLVTAGALVANGDHAVAIPGLNVNLGPLAGVAAKLTVIEAPQIGCGRRGEAEAHDAQVRLDLQKAQVNVPGVAKVGLSGSIHVASTSGLLSDVSCDPKKVTIDATTSIVSVDLTLKVSVSLDLGLFSIPIANVPVKITGTAPPANTQTVDIDIATNGYEVPGTVGTGNSGLPWLKVDTSGLTLLGIPLGILTDGLISPLLSVVVNPLIQGLDAALLTPVLRALGSDLAGAKIYAKPTPSCGEPRLVG
ncbi:pilus assembly protein TadG-related protein [Nocardioides sp. SYSU DS0663]|uniref:pilus assembly protein TadG-related protein n=1 Tax=Nocardioides sp. SYSU DS0663 TaxID=3416445 RepID=UPI003F4C5F8A